MKFNDIRGKTGKSNVLRKQNRVSLTILNEGVKFTRLTVLGKFLSLKYLGRRLQLQISPCSVHCSMSSVNFSEKHIAHDRF